MPNTVTPAMMAYLADRSAWCYAEIDLLNVLGGITARLPGFRGDLGDEVCIVDFRRGRATGGMVLRPNLGDGKRQEYSFFSGTIVVTYGLLRVKNIESLIPGCMTVLDEKEATIRALNLRSARNFTVGRLANYEVDDIIEDQPPEYSVDRTNDRERDVVKLYFGVSYARLMANFPVA